MRFGWLASWLNFPIVKCVITINIGKQTIFGYNYERHSILITVEYIVRLFYMYVFVCTIYVVAISVIFPSYVTSSIQVNNIVPKVIALVN